MRNGGEQREGDTTWPSTAGSLPAQERAAALVALGRWLFAQTDGQPLYLLETLKLFRDRQWLVPRLGADGTWRLQPTEDMAAAGAQDGSGSELLPPSGRAMILARLAPLSPATRHRVLAV